MRTISTVHEIMDLMILDIYFYLKNMPLLHIPKIYTALSDSVSQVDTSTPKTLILTCRMPSKWLDVVVHSALDAGVLSVPLHPEAQWTEWQDLQTARSELYRISFRFGGDINGFGDLTETVHSLTGTSSSQSPVQQS